MKQFNWRCIAAKFIECLHDDRGVAMTEYLIMAGITLPLVAYLFHPDNGIYQTARRQYDLTTLLLMLPGP